MASPRVHEANWLLRVASHLSVRISHSDKKKKKRSYKLGARLLDGANECLINDGHHVGVGEGRSGSHKGKKDNSELQKSTAIDGEFESEHFLKIAWTRM